MDLVFARVREELRAGGCAVCRLAAYTERRFLDNLLYERVNDPHTREDLRSSWGFCPRHAWMLPAHRSPVLGVAILYQDLLQTLRARLEAWSRSVGTRPLSRRARALLTPAAACPACAHRTRMEEVYLASLLDHLEDPEVGAALSGPAPLCLPHFLRAVVLAGSPRVRLRLVELYAEALSRLEQDVAELVRKHDHRFRGEGFTPSQASSWLRALELFSGRDPCEARPAPDLRPQGPP